MAQKDRKSAYEDELTDAKWMVDGVSDGGFSLEEILAEYGRGTKGILTEPKEEPPAPPMPETPRPVPEKKPARRKEELTAEAPAAPPAAEKPEKPAEKAVQNPEEPASAARPLRFAKDKPVQPITVADVVSRTVDEVLEEELLPPPRRGLFSRRKFVETEELYERAGVTKPVREEDDGEEIIGP